MSILSENIKWLRKQMKITQTELAEQLNLNRPIIGSYEEARAEPKSEVLVNLARCFNVSVDELLSENLSEKAGGNNTEEQASGKNLRILSVVVDEKSGVEKIPLVPVKAAAGYLQGYGDPEFIEQLSTFELPFQEINAQRTYRMFQITGDSMLPVPDKAYIITSYVQDWNQIKTGTCCIAVTLSNGIVYKRLNNQLKERGSFILHSDNELYEPFEVAAGDIREIWQAHGYVSFELP